MTFALAHIGLIDIFSSFGRWGVPLSGLVMFILNELNSLSARVRKIHMYMTVYL